MATPTHQHHALDYIEISVTDMEATRRFYASAFGWTFNDYGAEYTGIQDPDRDGAELGGFALTEQLRAGGPLLLLYSVDLDASVKAVLEAGGRVLQEP